MSLFAELKRRNVFKVGAAYLALGWIVVQATATLTPAFHLPEAALPLVTWIGVIGFPFVLVFAWIYELTPEGLKRESELDRSQSITHITSRRLDYIIIAMLAVAMMMFVADRFLLRDGGAGAARDSSIDSDAKAGDRAQVALPRESGGGQESSLQQPVQAPDEKSIAVLPFADMSAGRDQGYMSDGIAEELLNLLVKIPELRVTSRSSAFSFKGKDLEIPEIARRLNVAHVLEGSVRTSGNRIRITAQLVDTRSDTHLWSETYDRTLDDIFAVQDEIAGAVVGQLKIALLGAAPTARVVDPKAYALYLQARQLGYQGTPAGWEQAATLYQQALAIDAEYAAAWEGLAMNYAQQAGWGLRPLEEGYALAREAIARALAIDPDYAPAHAALGRIAMLYDRDLAAAARHYQHAVALEPANADILLGGAVLCENLGRCGDSARALREYLVSRDPVNPRGYAGLAFSHLYAGRFDEAAASARTAISLAPGRSGQQYNLGMVLLLKRELDAALAAMQQESLEAWRLIGLALVQHARGQSAEADAALAELIVRHEKEWPYNIAYVLAFRGEADRAFEWLDKAVAHKDGGLSEIVQDPLLARLHNDPRWLPFLRKIGMAPEQLAAIDFELKLPPGVR